MGCDGNLTRIFEFEDRRSGKIKVIEIKLKNIKTIFVQHNQKNKLCKYTKIMKNLIFKVVKHYETAGNLAKKIS